MSKKNESLYVVNSFQLYFGRVEPFSCEIVTHIEKGKPVTVVIDTREYTFDIANIPERIYAVGHVVDFFFGKRVKITINDEEKTVLVKTTDDIIKTHVPHNLHLEDLYDPKKVEQLKEREHLESRVPLPIDRLVMVDLPVLKYVEIQSDTAMTLGATLGGTSVSMVLSASMLMGIFLPSFALIILGMALGAGGGMVLGDILGYSKYGKIGRAKAIVGLTAGGLTDYESSKFKILLVDGGTKDAGYKLSKVKLIFPSKYHHAITGSKSIPHGFPQLELVPKSNEQLHMSSVLMRVKKGGIKGYGFTRAVIIN